MILALVALAAICALGLTVAFPRAACVLWIFLLETSPDSWLDNLIGAHETIIGVMKAFGLVLVAVMALDFGVKRDRYNPSLAFAFMFIAGLMHGMYPGLTLLSSTRSLIGSAGPFLFSFVRIPAAFIQAIKRAAIWGPLFTTGFGGLLAVTGLDHMYVVEQGALRLGASGEPPFLAGFALIGIYAGLMEYLRQPRFTEILLLLVNLVIILLTGARGPLALALLICCSVLVIQRRLLLLAAAGAAASLVLIFLNAFTFLRVVDLTQLGEAVDLSNRNLVWPYFQQAFLTSPFFGWGVGAGKIIIPVTSQLTALIGTNAAHDEYLRIGAEGGLFGLLLLIALLFLWVKHHSAPLPRDERWLMRLVFLSFALQSATDNTLIATTSSVFFIWVSAVFATAPEEIKPAA
jgi:O-antigen ligase